MFFGTQSEVLALDTLFWDEREDVKKLFETVCDSQINYSARKIYTTTFKQEGYNDQLVWCVDFAAQGFVGLETGYKPWFTNTGGNE